VLAGHSSVGVGPVYAPAPVVAYAPLPAPLAVGYVPPAPGYGYTSGLGATTTRLEPATLGMPVIGHAHRISAQLGLDLTGMATATTADTGGTGN
jgi:hypothetical protein